MTSIAIPLDQHSDDAIYSTYLGYRNLEGDPTSPTEKQAFFERMFFESLFDYYLLHGGTGSGKTAAAVQVAIIKQMLKKPGLNCCVGHIDHNSLRSSVLFHIFKQLGPKTRIINGKTHIIWEHSKRDQNIIVRLPDMVDPYLDYTAKIDYRPLDPSKGLDQKLADSGASYGTFIWDQCENPKSTLSVWQAILPRMREEPKKIVLTANPNEQSWYVPLFVTPDPTKVKDIDKFVAILMNPYDNQYLPDSYITGIKSQFSEAMWQRYIEGSYQPIQGKILAYDVKHTFAPISRVPSDWKIFESVDYGLKDPCVVQWWGVDPQGAFWLFDSIKERGEPAPDVGLKMLPIRREWLRSGYEDYEEGPRFIDACCDPTMGRQPDNGGKSVIQQFADAGVYLKPSRMTGEKFPTRAQISILVKMHNSGKLHICTNQGDWFTEESRWTWAKNGKEEPNIWRQYEADGQTVVHHFDHMAAMRYFASFYYGNSAGVDAESGSGEAPTTRRTPDYSDFGGQIVDDGDPVDFYTSKLFR